MAAKCFERPICWRNSRTIGEAASLHRHQKLVDNPCVRGYSRDLLEGEVRELKSIEQEVAVQFRYSVHFTRDLFSSSNPLLSKVIATSDDPKPAKALVVVDAGVERCHPALLDKVESYAAINGETMSLAAPVLVVPGGEEAKNHPRHADKILHEIHRAGLCRHSYVIAVGGGAVLDVAGYAAATAHRGVRLIRVPTTVLAQDDSGVGVKNGINGFDKKNYVGTFAPPYAVINDFSFLSTLADRDWRSGISEAIKAALIKDASFFDWIEKNAGALANRDLPAMETLIHRCAALHLAHIAGSGDPFEMGSARPLDFGHWSAHKLEQLTHYGLRHGEAVAIGIAVDCTYSYLSGYLSQADWRRIVDLFGAVGLPVFAPELCDHLDDEDHPESVLQGLAEFREHLGGQLTIMLLRRIGKAFDVNEVSRETMIRAIGTLRAEEQWTEPVVSAATENFSTGELA